MKGALKLTKKDVDYINGLWKDFQQAGHDTTHIAIEQTEKDQEWKVVNLRK